VTVVALLTKEVENAAGKTQKTQNVFKAQAVHDPLVSERQKLHESLQQENQPAADAAADGTQSRMAPLKSVISAKPGSISTATL
jgi:hypothetical protein